MLFATFAATLAALTSVAAVPTADKHVAKPIGNSAGKHIAKPFTPTHEASIAAGVPIQYYGGYIMSTVHVYIIYYGYWTANQKTIVQSFFNNVGSSKWWNITKLYSGKNGYAASTVQLSGVTTDNYSQGYTLTDIPGLVRSHIGYGIPEDPNGLYFVLSSSDVAEGSFCSQYCGYHYYDQFASGNYMKYSFVGAPPVGACDCFSPNNRNVSPNGDVSIDAMISVVAHELTEATTDPFLDAWKDANGNENGDKCAWTFGKLTSLSNGAVYNEVFGNRGWLIQQNWNPKTQSCVQSA